MIATRKSNRHVGKIRQATISTLSQTTDLNSVDNIPHVIKDLTINNVNLYSEAKEIGRNCVDAFDKYEEIIRNLENVIENLLNKNAFISQERFRLINENIQLRKEIENMRENYFVGDSRVMKNVAIFDIVPQEDSIPAVFPKPMRKKKEILQQSQYDISAHNHHFSPQISADLSMSQAQAKQQQKTPCLNRHHTTIQCKYSNNQTPLRVFYLLLLQHEYMIKKLKTLIDFCIQDDTKTLMYLLPKQNQLWAKILQQFLNSITKGKFENEQQIIQYISQNPLIDMLLVSLLKLYMPLQNQDQNLNIGDWKNQRIDHKKLFQALCNQFDLRFQCNGEQICFYVNNCQKSVSQNMSSEFSQENLLASRTQMEQKPAEISLFNINNNNKPSMHCSQTRLQPIFKIQIDPQRQYYRINLSIRPSKYNETDQYQSSFHKTQNSLSQNSLSCMRNQQNSDGQKSQYQYKNVFLKQRDMNYLCVNNRQRQPRQKYKNHQYLKQNADSKYITGSNSKISQNSYRYEE